MLLIALIRTILFLGSRFTAFSILGRLVRLTTITRRFLVRRCLVLTRIPSISG